MLKTKGACDAGEEGEEGAKLVWNMFPLFYWLDQPISKIAGK